MKRGLPVEPMHEAITSFDVVNAFSAQARLGADVEGAVDTALIAFIRQRVDELMATLEPAAQTGAADCAALVAHIHG